jgi:ribonuclease HI
VPRIVEDALLVYTDGSLYPKGRKGGYGIVFIHVDHVGHETQVEEHAPPGARGVTNNRMELQACIDALKRAPETKCFDAVSKVVVRTDSRYVTGNYRNALGRWRTSGWRNLDGKPIDNADLWKELVKAYGKVPKRVEIEWVKGHGKGHAKDPNNYRADKLAKESANSPLAEREFRSSVRRKFAPGATKPGSVSLLGQVLVIYIVEVLRQRVQKTWKYRYQVASQDSPDLHAIDWAHSDEHMRDGHFYEVQMNDDMRHPQILGVLREVPRKEIGAPSSERSDSEAKAADS